MPEETRTHLFSCEFCKISKNAFSYRTPPVAASEHTGTWKRSLLSKLVHLRRGKIPRLAITRI